LSQLNQNRYDQLMRRVADLKGPGSKVNDVLTELFPVLDVEQAPAELLLLAGTRLCMGTASVAAGGPGNFTTIFLRNPGDSGVIARLFYVSLAGTDGTILLGPSLNSAPQVGTLANADGRIFGDDPTLQLQGNNNNLVAGVVFNTLVTGADGFIQWEPPVAIGVITPGTAFSFGRSVADLSLRVNVMWIERPAQPSELNL